MDWSNLFPILLALLAVIGFPLALRSRKKAGPRKVEELRQHLRGIGVKSSERERGIGQGGAAPRRSWGQKSVGIVELRDRNIDSIDVIGAAGQYGVRYFLDFLVRSVSLTGRDNKKKTRLVRKRASAFSSTVTELKWKGDDYLVRKLELDYRLEDKLLQANANVLRGGISISPAAGDGYTRIRTAYFLPTPNLFEALDIIAGHVRSGQ